MNRLFWLSLLFFSCAPQPRDHDGSACVPELPDPARSRAKQVVCNDELQGNHAERGDWLLQSAALSVYIRTERFALSRADRAGGTLLDIVGSAGSPDVEELVPLLPLQDGSLDWFTDIDIEAIEDDKGAGLSVSGMLPDGSPGGFLWWMDHGSARLELRGATDFDVVPLPNSAVRGDVLSYGANLVSPGRITGDEGGWFRWTDTTFLEPASDAALPTLLPDRYTQSIAGLCRDGELLYLRDADGDILQRVDITVTDGEFAFLGDNRATEIICLATARQSSGWQPLPSWEEGEAPAEDVQLTVGSFGELSVRVTDSAGNLVPATVWWNDSSYWFGLGEGTLSVGAGPGRGLAGAGPAWSAVPLSPQEVTEDSSTQAVLTRVLPDTVMLANFFIEAWPHHTTRSSSSSRVGRNIAAGVEWAITVADHAVSPTDVSQLEQDEAWFSSGARSRTEVGTITSWPWSFNRKANLWGAPDTHGLDAHAALAVMGGGRGLRTIVDTVWVEHAGPPYSWPVLPDALYIDRLDELPTYMDLLDQYTGLALVGPLTWIDGVDRRTMPQVEAERALDLRQTMATTGPLVQLRMGDAVETPSPTDPRKAHLQVTAPVWMPVDHVALMGSGGVTLAEWNLADPIEATRLDATVELPPGVDWVLAVAWSDRTNPPLQTDPPWTVTSAVFLDGP